MMLESRRSVLRTISRTLGLLAAASVVKGAAQGPPPPMPSPNAPRNQNVPAGMDGPDLIHPNKAPLNPVIQQDITAKTQQLFKLATELKDEVEHTNLNSTFSLAFFKKAQQVEKLAKQIKDRARG